MLLVTIVVSNIKLLINAGFFYHPGMSVAVLCGCTVLEGKLHK
jgi:hypothetical protein